MLQQGLGCKLKTFPFTRRDKAHQRDTEEDSSAPSSSEELRLVFHFIEQFPPQKSSEAAR